MAAKLDVDFELKYIVHILQEINCPIIGNADDWWINELLFIPGNHRFQLFDWILLQFEFNEAMQLKKNDNENETDYLQIFSAMGLCGKKDSKLITGEAIKSTQLKFWKMLFEMIHSHSAINAKMNVLNTGKCLPSSLFENSDHSQKETTGVEVPAVVNDVIINCSGVNQLENKSKENGNMSNELMEEKFLKSSSIVANISQNVNLNDLFVEKLALFEPDIDKDIGHMLSSNQAFIDKLPKVNSKMQIENVSDEDFLSLFPISSKKSTPRTSISENLESQKREAISLFHEQAMHFTNTHREIKPVLQTTGIELNNFGSEFKQIHSKMEAFNKFISYLNMMESISRKTTLKNFIPSELNLTASDLEDYISILQEKLDT